MIRDHSDNSDSDPDIRHDILACQALVAKIRNRKNYAQNLYAAFCNISWRKNAIWPILKDQRFGMSWRASGAFIAQVRGSGDYLDWYCSGIRDIDWDDQVNSRWDNSGHVAEGTVTEEIRQDLAKLGWSPVLD